MTDQEIDLLCSSYLSETNSYRKNKLLNQLFIGYLPWTRQLCRKYVNHEENADDIKQHVHIGIVNGILYVKEEETYRNSIFRNVRKEISNQIIRPKQSQKTSRGKDLSIPMCYEIPIYSVKEDQSMNSFESTIPDNRGLCKPMWNEDQIILQIDLENAIERLPDPQRRIIQMWLQGYSVKEIKECLQLTAAVYTSIIYYHFRRCKRSLRQVMVGYAV